jgi:hypothetical protein
VLAICKEANDLDLDSTLSDEEKVAAAKAAQPLPADSMLSAQLGMLEQRLVRCSVWVSVSRCARACQRWPGMHAALASSNCSMQLRAPTRTTTHHHAPTRTDTHQHAHTPGRAQGQLPGGQHALLPGPGPVLRAVHAAVRLHDM